MVVDHRSPRNTPGWVGPTIVYLVSLTMLILSRILSRYNTSLFFGLTIDLLVFALPIVTASIYVKQVEKGEFWPSVGIRHISLRRVLILSLALYFVVFASTWTLFSTAEYLSPRLPPAARYDPRAVGEAFGDLPNIVYWYMIFTSIVYAGVGEEVIFRGFVLTRLSKRTTLSLVGSSLMWSSLHLWYLPVLGSTGIWQHIVVVLTGFTFGISYIKIKNLIPLIIVHAVMDVFLPLSFLYPGPLLNTVAFIALISGFVATIGILAHQVFRGIITRGSEGTLNPTL
ncbi:MAG: type II CAAX endopeptidase family protein [archaeon]